MPLPSLLLRRPAPSAAPALPLSGDRPLAAIGLILSAMLVFSLMDGLSKVLTAEYPVLQIAWARYFFILAFLAPFLLRDGARRLRSTRPHLQIARGFCMLGSSVLFVAGLARMPIADATSLGFVSPFFVTALSIPLLSEKVGVRRWSALLVGFVGVLIVIRPGSAAFNPAAFLPIASAACWAVGLIITRMMHSSDQVLTTLAWSTAVGFAALTPAVLPGWQPPSLAGWAIFVCISALSTVGQLCLISGFRFAPASLLAPFSYSQIVWATLIGFFVFATLPDAQTWIGAAIVVASGLYVLHRERVVRRQEALKR
jgi:drug/metabolite transporter (DMT)-like permease